MSSDFVNVMAMLGNWVSGIGATSAVVYAVNVNKSGLKCYPRSPSKYNRNIEIELFNHKQVKAHITGLYIEFLDRNSLIKQQVVNIESLKELVDYCMVPGERLNFVVQFDELMEMYFSNILWNDVHSVFNIPEVRIVVSVLNGRSKAIKLNESYYCELLEKFMIHKEQSIMSPYRGSGFGGAYIVPSYEVGKTDYEIVKNRIDSYMFCYGKLIFLHAPRFKLRNKVRLLLAQSYSHSKGN